MASVGTPAGRGRRRRFGFVVPTASSSSLLVRWSMFLFVVLMVFVNVVVEATPQQPPRTILVTGGAGFVGSHLADALLERGDRVVIIDEVNDYYDVKIKEGNLRMLELKYNHCPGDKNVGDGNGVDETDHDDDHADQEDDEDRDCMLTIYRGDICNRTVLDQVFERHKFDAMAHLAARAGVRPSILDPFVYVHSNIKATIALLDRAVHHNISHFVYASSSSVYGGSHSTYFSENERVDRPISPYAWTKTACELFAYAYHKKFGINTAALRFFTVYGPRGRPDMAVWKFIDRVSHGKVIQQYGDGSSSRDYTYVSDIVQGIVAALDRPLGYKIYNLGKGYGTSLHELLRLVETQVGKAALVEVLPDQPGDVPYTCANISLAYHDLGYNATVPTDVGVAKTVAWYLATYPPPPFSNPSSSAAGGGAASTTSARRRRWLQSSQQHEESLPATWLDDAMDQDDVPIEFRNPRHRRKLLASSTAMERNDDRKTVLLTGGTRFLGSHVVDALLDRGDRVVLVDHMELTEQSRYNLNLLLQQYGESGRVMVHLGNLTDAAFLRAVFDAEAPRWICHVAGTVEDSRSFDESIQIVEQNLDPTLHLLDLAKGKHHGGFDVENFVIVGSSKIYGNRTTNDPSSLLLDEEDRVDAPLTPYAASKKSEELLAYTYHHLYNIPISILRVDAMFGPRHDLHSKSFEQFHQFLQNVTTTASSSAVEDQHAESESADHWVYVGDVVTALLSTLDHQHDYEIFNVGGRNCPQTLLSVFRTMDTLLMGIAIDAGSLHRQPCLSMDKTKQKLQFKPSVTLLEGVMETIQWHRELFDYSRISSVASATTNPFASSAARTRSDSRIRNSVVHYPYPAVPKVKRRSLMRDIACFQWAIVVAVAMYRSFKHHNGRSRRGRSPTPT